LPSDNRAAEAPYRLAALREEVPGGSATADQVGGEGNQQEDSSGGGGRE